MFVPIHHKTQNAMQAKNPFVAEVCRAPNALLDATHRGHVGYFVGLTPDQENHCALRYHVTARNSDACLKTRDWFQTRCGTRCTNPFAVATARFPRYAGGECFLYTQWDNVPASEVWKQAVFRHDELAGPLPDPDVVGAEEAVKQARALLKQLAKSKQVK